MLNQPTFDKLQALRWTGLAEAYRQQMENPELASLSFDERFALLLDQHWTWRENQAMARRLKKSKLDAEPCVEDINYATRGSWTGRSSAALPNRSGWPSTLV
jgi:hypothetical protein